MRKTRLVGILCLLASGGALIAPAAGAAERFGGSVAITTDYIYRGLSQTEGQPALQGGLRLTSGQGLSAGVWASSVEINHESTYELDLHAAFSFPIAPDWSAQIAYVHYAYPGWDGADYDYDELIGSLSYQQRLTAHLAWSPNTARYGNERLVRSEPSVAYELSLVQPLGPRWSLSAGVGYHDLDELFDRGYWFWNAGFVLTWQSMQLDLMHIGTDATARRTFGSEIAGARWIAALTWRF